MEEKLVKNRTQNQIKINESQSRKLDKCNCGRRMQSRSIAFASYSRKVEKNRVCNSEPQSREITEFATDARNLYILRIYTLRLSLRSRGK